ncbi:uncharacterized protein AMSG_12404 [Thecamonas trahens ATCC 50062]|uniref:Uncharacterized protein n=1 Tax=Thecamonas trahens ATCC 50062 TaxID=461836 RepID=A0A0L0DSL7_THETB|nr:hypothetical protein AMSG_12404 [Thecamonas trahens ATCC 50062]KNC55344.1 hypothetical protein AMSG_12404 [Thecamonas trahens ATCC 50062]|eukprot:XP_013753079.1 hypothetical protein AMSG_12404 [Thecamonas trahens ATCC 50062]
MASRPYSPIASPRPVTPTSDLAAASIMSKSDDMMMSKHGHEADQDHHHDHDNNHDKGLDQDGHDSVPGTNDASRRPQAQPASRPFAASDGLLRTPPPAMRKGFARDGDSDEMLADEPSPRTFVPSPTPPPTSPAAPSPVPGGESSSSADEPDGSERQRKRSILAQLNSKEAQDRRQRSKAAVASSLVLDSVVRVSNTGHFGVIRFVGETKFAPGLWVGLEMEEPVGKHDGLRDGVRYFQARYKHALFVRPSRVKVILRPHVSASVASPPRPSTAPAVSAPRSSTSVPATTATSTHFSRRSRSELDRSRAYRDRDMLAKLSVGTRVTLRDRSVPGTVAYIGRIDRPAHTSRPATASRSQKEVSDVFVGVALDVAAGKNDGSVKGTRFFTCKPQHGVFVRPSALALLKVKLKPQAVAAVITGPSGSLSPSTASGPSTPTSPEDANRSFSFSGYDECLSGPLAEPSDGLLPKRKSPGRRRLGSSPSIAKTGAGAGANASKKPRASRTLGFRLGATEPPARALDPDTTPAPARDYTWNERFQEVVHLPALTPAQAEVKAQAIAQLSQELVAAATPVVKTIVNELHIPFPDKTIKPVTQSVGGMAGGDKYIRDGLFFKLARDVTGAYGGDENAAHAAHHEMDALAALLKANIPGLHFPLTAVISYCGHTVSVASLLPIDASTLVYGSADGGATLVKSNHDMDAMMQLAGSALNLKGHVVSGSRSVAAGSRRSDAFVFHGPADMEGHLGHDGRFYVVDMARLFPPEAPASDAPKGTILYRLLRPEAVAAAPTPLSSDAFSRMGRHNHHLHNTEVAHATAALYTHTIPVLARELLAAESEHALSATALASSSLGFFASRGLSTRHLGALRSHVPAASDGVAAHLREWLTTYMVAHTFGAQLSASLRRTLRKRRNRISRKTLVVQHFNALLAWQVTDPFGIVASMGKTRLAKPGRRCPLGGFWCGALFRGIEKRFVGFPDVHDGAVPKAAAVPVASTLTACPRCAWLRGAVDRELVFKMACATTGVRFEVTSSYLAPETMAPLSVEQLAGVGVVSRHLEVLPLVHASTELDTVYASELARLARLADEAGARGLDGAQVSGGGFLIPQLQVAVDATVPGRAVKVVRAMVRVHLNVAELAAASGEEAQAVSAFRAGLHLAGLVWGTGDLAHLYAWQQYADVVSRMDGGGLQVARVTYEWLLAQLPGAPGPPPTAQAVPLYVDVQNNLGNVLMALGDEAGAVEAYSAAVALREADGMRAEALVNVLNNLALAHSSSEPDKALALFQRTLKLLDGGLVMDKAARAMVLNNMAVLVERSLVDVAGGGGGLLAPARRMSQVSGAEARVLAMYSRAHALKAKSLPADDERLASTAFNLGRLAVVLGCYGEALPYLTPLAASGSTEAGVLVARAHIGLGAPSKALPVLYGLVEDARRGVRRGSERKAVFAAVCALAEHYEALAGAQAAAGQLSGARRSYLLLLQMLARVYGPRHPVLCRPLRRVAQVLVGECKFDGARQALAYACGICDAVFGPEVTALSGMMAALGHVVCGVGSSAESVSLAGALFAFDAQTAELAHGASSPRMVDALNNLGWCQLQAGEVGRAVAVFERALAASKEASDGAHLGARARVLNNLAFVRLEASEFDEAEALLRRALFICERVRGPEHIDLAVVLTNLAGVYVRTGNYTLAESMLYQSLRIKTKVLSPAHPSLVANLELLAGLHASRGQMATARRLLEGAQAAAERALGSEHPLLARMRENTALVQAGSMVTASSAWLTADHLIVAREAPVHAIGNNGGSLVVPQAQLWQDFPADVEAVRCAADASDLLPWSDVVGENGADSYSDRIECIFLTDHPEWYIGTVAGKVPSVGIFPAKYVELEAESNEVLALPTRGVVTKPFRLNEQGWGKALPEEAASKLLELETGDFVYFVMTTAADDWLYGESHGECGYFPAAVVNLLEPVYPPEIPPRKVGPATSGSGDKGESQGEGEDGVPKMRERAFSGPRRRSGTGPLPWMPDAARLKSRTRAESDTQQRGIGGGEGGERRSTMAAGRRRLPTPGEGHKARDLPAPPMAPKPATLPGAASDGESEARAAAPPPPVAGSTLAVRKVLYLATALYAYSDNEVARLEVEVGDQFEVLNDKGDWWWVYSKRLEKEGYVPGNYMERVAASEAGVPSAMSTSAEAGRPEVQSKPKSKGKKKKKAAPPQLPSRAKSKLYQKKGQLPVNG